MQYKSAGCWSPTTLSIVKWRSPTNSSSRVFRNRYEPISVSKIFWHAVIQACSSRMCTLFAPGKLHDFWWVRIDSHQRVRSKSELRKKVWILAVDLLPILKSKFGEASTRFASISLSFFRCLSLTRETVFFSSRCSSMSWSLTVDACDLSRIMLTGEFSFGSTGDSSDTMNTSFSGMNHLRSKPSRSRPVDLYFAHAMTSLKRNKCLNFLLPSANSTITEFLISLRSALSSFCAEKKEEEKNS